MRQRNIQPLAKIGNFGFTLPQTIKPAKGKRTLFKAFVEGFLTNALNPKVLMFYLAAFPQFISTANGSLNASFLPAFVHSMINLIWFAAMVLLLSRITQANRSNRFQCWLKAITGIVFIGFGLKLATLKT